MFSTFALMTFLLGCSPTYVQLVETKTTNTKIVNDKYVFENDSIKITYNFWKEKGLLNFTVFNKLKKPLYIDWKKSSYINNSIKLNYWEDEENTKTVGSQSSLSYRVRGTLTGFTNTSSISSSLTTKPEKLTFVPPNSNYTRQQFYLLPTSFLNVPTKNYTTEKITDINNSKKQSTVFTKEFDKNDTPLIFRNFITFSYSDKFENEFYLDNEFYVSKVTKMDKRQLGVNKFDNQHGRYFQDESGRAKIFSAFEKGTSYYVFMYPR